METTSGGGKRYATSNKMIPSVALGNFLLWLGLADPQCLCGHKWSEHDFDAVTPKGFCQNGSWASGCDCMIYEVKGSRPVEKNRHLHGV